MRFGAAALLPTFTIIIIISSALTSAARAQSLPSRDSRELSLWFSGGRGTTGRTSDTGVLLGGLRYGWMLTRSHGPRLIRGRFEYAVDAIPVFLVLQEQNAYGVGVNPVVLKWIFDFDSSDHHSSNHHRSFAPYMEATAGVLFSSHDVPPGTSNVNFTPGAALGLQFLGHRWNPNFAVRYLHISNAGLSKSNPGINTIQVTFGLTHIFGEH